MNKSWFILELFTDLPKEHTSNFTNIELVENITVQASDIAASNSVYINDKERYIYENKLEVIHIES